MSRGKFGLRPSGVSPYPTILRLDVVREMPVSEREADEHCGEGADMSERSRGEGSVAGAGVGVVTHLLRRSDGGDARALDELFEVVYDELRRMAAGRLRGERADHTLQATALVHELFLKMSDGAVAARDRRHFMGVAARAMRQILVDHARRKTAGKRGGGAMHTTLGGHDVAERLDPAGLLDLDRALDALDERQRRVVELRFFVGLEEREIAEALDVTERTVRRDWVKARAWLYAALYGEGDGSSTGAGGSGTAPPPGSSGGARAA